MVNNWFKYEMSISRSYSMIYSQSHNTIPVQQKLTKSSAMKTYKIKKNAINEKKREGQSLYPWHYNRHCENISGIVPHSYHHFLFLCFIFKPILFLN